MKYFIGLFLMLSTGFAMAQDQCVPDSAVVCTIGYICTGNNSYYELRTTFQSINSIYVDSPETTCGLVPAEAVAALTKLEAQAQQLLTAGVCKIVINNLAN